MEENQLFVNFESDGEQCAISTDERCIYIRTAKVLLEVDTKQGYYATPTMEYLRDGVQAAVEMVVAAIAGAVDSTQESQQ